MRNRFIEISFLLAVVILILPTAPTLANQCADLYRGNVPGSALNENKTFWYKRYHSSDGSVFSPVEWISSDYKGPGSELYQAYRLGNLTFAQFSAKAKETLPKVTVLGDSLLKNFALQDTLLKSFRLMWRQHIPGKNAVEDFSGSVSQNLLYLTSKKVGPVIVDNDSIVASNIIERSPKIVRQVINTTILAEQVDRALKNPRLSNLFLLLMGNNDTNWPEFLKNVDSYTFLHDPTRARQLKDRIVAEAVLNVRTQIDKVIRRIILEVRSNPNQRFGIVVFGLPDYVSYYKAAEIAEKMHRQNSKVYPNIDHSMNQAKSYRPENRALMLEINLALSEALKEAVEEIKSKEEYKLLPWNNFKISYSDAIHKVDLSDVAVMDPVDGWHLSYKGRSLFGAALHEGSFETLKFIQAAPASVSKPKELATTKEIYGPGFAFTPQKDGRFKSRFVMASSEIERTGQPLQKLAAKTLNTMMAPVSFFSNAGDLGRFITRMTYDTRPLPFWTRFSDAIELKIAVDHDNLTSAIPKDGPLVIIAAHSGFGIHDAIPLAAIVDSQRSSPDTKVVLSGNLADVPEIKSNAILMDESNTEHGARNRHLAYEQMREHLKSGGSLVLFPSGKKGQRTQDNDGSPKFLDAEWMPHAFDLANDVRNLSIVPAFTFSKVPNSLPNFSGKWSDFSLLTLPAELKSIESKEVALRFGTKYNGSDLLRSTYAQTSLLMDGVGNNQSKSSPWISYFLGQLRTDVYQLAVQGAPKVPSRPASDFFR